MDMCEREYFNLTGDSLLSAIFARKSQSELEKQIQDENLKRTDKQQPALFAIEWSLARMCLAFKITPSIVLGHSVGEISAACVSGGISMATGMKLTVVRG